MRKWFEMMGWPPLSAVSTLRTGTAGALLAAAEATAAAAATIVVAAPLASAAAPTVGALVSVVAAKVGATSVGTAHRALHDTRQVATAETL